MTYNIAYGIEMFYPAINGIITSSLNILKNMVKMKHNPILLVPEIFEKGQSMVEGIPVYFIPSKPLHVYPDLRRTEVTHPLTEEIMLKHNINMVHITAPWHLGKAMYRVAKKHGIARIHSYHTSLHDMEYLEYIHQHLHIPRFLLKFYSKYICWSRMGIGKYFLDSHVLTTPSAAYQTLLQSKYPNIPTYHIPNGIDTDSFQETPDKELLASLLPSFPADRNIPYVLYIGRLGIEKSIHILLQGFAQAKKNLELKDLQLVIIGDGPEHAALTVLAEKLDVKHSVVFLGAVPHKHILRSGIIKSAKLFCTPSTSENYAMTVIEAICSKTPMLLARHVSMTNLAGDLAHYFTPHDPSSLAHEMTQLYGNHVLYQEYKNKLETSTQQFDGKEVCKKYLSAYDTAYKLAQAEKSA